MMRRRYPRRRRLRIPKYDEVKVFQLGLDKRAITIEHPTTSDTTMYGSAFLLNSVLSNITQGTAAYNRIGNKIYVLSITVKANVWTCSADDAQYNTALMRVIVGEPIGTPGTTTFPNFFRSPCRDKLIGGLNRTFYTFHYDKTYKIESGYPNSLASAADGNRFCGAMRHIEFKLPLNRSVEYTSAGGMKNQRDYYSLFATALTPNPATGNNRQVLCSDWLVTIYYVDA